MAKKPAPGKPIGPSKTEAPAKKALAKKTKPKKTEKSEKQTSEEKRPYKGW